MAVEFDFISNNRASADIEQLRRQMRQLGRTVRDNTRATADNTRAFNTNRRAAASLRSTLTGLRSTLVGIGAVRIAQSIGRTGVEFDRLRILIQASSNSAQEFVSTMQDVRRLARLPGITFESAAAGISQLTALGFSAQFAAQATEEIGNAIALSATSSEQDVPRIVRAFAQIRESAQLMQQDLNQIIQSGPLLGRAIREEFGSIRADVINQQVANPQEFLERLIGRARVSVPRVPADASFNVIQNFRNAIRELSDAIAQLALPRLTQQIERATQLIEQNTQQIVESLRGAADIVVGAVDRIINSFRELINLLRSGLLAALFLRLGQGIASLGPALRTFGANQAAAGGVVNFLRSFALGGIAAGGTAGTFGRIATAVGTLGVGFQALAGVFAVISAVSLVRFLAGVNNAARATTTLSGRVNTLTERVRDLNVEVARLPRGGIFQGIEQPQITELTTRLSRVVGTLRDVREEITRIEQTRQAPLEQIQARTRAELSRLRDQEVSGIAGRGIRARIQQERTFLQNINTLLRERSALQAEILRIEAQITAQTQAQEEATRRLVPTGTPTRGTGTQQRPDDVLARGNIQEIEQRQLGVAGRLGQSFGRFYSVAISQALRQGSRNIIQLRNIAGLERFAERQAERARALGRQIGQAFNDSISEGIQRTGSRIIAQRNRQAAQEQFVQDDIQRFRDLGRIVGLAYREAIFDAADSRGERIIRQRNTQVAQEQFVRENVERFRDLGRSIGQALREQIDEGLRPLTQGVANIASGLLTGAAGYPGRLRQAERDAAEERLEIEEDLQERIDEIRNNAELSARQRARRIANAEADAAQQRRDVERQLADDRREAYRGFLRDALRNLAQLVSAEIQAAIVRSQVANIATAVSPALAALGPFGGLGAGLFAIAGLNLFSSSFHNPVLDRAAQNAGFRNARNNLLNNPQSFGEQSGRDLVSNYDRGFQEGLANSQGSGSPTGDRQPVILQVEGRELARVLIDLNERGEIPALS